MLSAARWDVALLQECPPRWSAPLARACAAQPHRALTSRNSLAALRALAARINPDLVASNEGGSNLTLIRRGRLRECRQLELRPGRRPERRVMAFSRLALDPERELCIANLHASAGRALREAAEQEVVRAAERAVEWAGAAPLLFGGDLNLRPRDTAIYKTWPAGSGFTNQRLPVRSTICSSGASRSSPNRHPGRLTAARSGSAASRCDSPTTRRSRRRSHEPPIARAYGAASGRGMR